MNAYSWHAFKYQLLWFDFMDVTCETTTTTTTTETTCDMATHNANTFAYRAHKWQSKYSCQLPPNLWPSKWKWKRNFEIYSEKFGCNWINNFIIICRHLPISQFPYLSIEYIFIYIFLSLLFMIIFGILCTAQSRFCRVIPCNDDNKWQRLSMCADWLNCMCAFCRSQTQWAGDEFEYTK